MRTPTILLTLLATTAVCAEDLRCLTDAERTTANLYHRLQQQAYAALDRRLEAYARLKTPADLRAYQKRLREFFVRQLGGFPAPGPLNSRTVGTIDADGYRIEKVIYESLPRHHITANLYLPDGDGPFPGVVVSSGHSRTAKAADYNQRFGIMLARHGMAVLCFDPIGQGERSQILDEQGQPRFRSTTTEHFAVGVGSILVGRNTARYRIWDAMRSIDYLVSRPEVDPKRIGMTGCSGGGTLTSYTMALDDRVACAAPSCYLTNFRRLIETIGPQDAEQNIYDQLGFGLDQPDYVLLRAPKPTLISSTTDDFFAIRGTWETFRQAKRFYAKLGFPERVDLVEVEGKHGVQPQNLATITYWLQRWLLGRDRPVAPVELPVRTEKELRCTESGQVLGLKDEQSVFDLNAAHAAELVKRRRALWKTTPEDRLRTRIREKLGLREDNEKHLPTWRRVGEVERDGYAIEKFVLKTEADALLPVLAFRPSNPNGETCLYLHDDGKGGDAAVGGPIERLTRQGITVFSVDLPGQGETTSGRRDPRLGNWKAFYLAYLLGRPLVGIRVDDLFAATYLASVNAAKNQTPSPIPLIAVGDSGVVAMHAAALRPELFASVTLEGGMHDWTSLVGEPIPSGELEATVHAALELYDLPDLVRLAGRDKVSHQPQGPNRQR